MTLSPETIEMNERTRSEFDPDYRRGASVVRLADVAPERVQWLWPGRIPVGKLTVKDGDPALGKSTLAMDIAARITTGSPMPGTDHRNPPGSVLLLSAEDGIADTIRPRAGAAGADLDRLLVLESIPVYDDEGFEVAERPPSIPGDLVTIESLIVNNGVVLVIVDVLNAYLSGKVDAYRDQDVRGALMPLAKMAERTGAAVLVLRHLSKTGGTNAVYRGGGSIGIIGAARAGLLVGVDPQDDTRRVLAVTKSNLAAMPPALAYRLVSDEELGCARVQWEGETAHKASDLLGTEDGDDRLARDDAADYLRELLGDGPMPAKQVEQLATQAGITKSTLRRARERAGVVSRKQGFGADARWLWCLEGAHQPSIDAEDVQSHDVDIFDALAAPVDTFGEGRA